MREEDAAVSAEERKTKPGIDQFQNYAERGYDFPIEVFSPSEVAEFRRYFDEFYLYHQEQLRNLPANKHGSIYGHTHTFLRWVYRMVSHPRVLDAVEVILGPNLTVRDTAWFVKMPGDKKYISWHQDGTYWGLHPPKATTAWIALSDSNSENGCMRVIPGSHKHLQPHQETYAEDNALSRGQEIAVKVEEREAVDIVLRPGQMSLHDVAIVHGSRANTSDKPRIGIAARYMPPEVVQDGNVRQLALLVRGEDDYSHVDLIDPPQHDDLSRNDLQVESLDRLFRNARSLQR
jgi:ectoine hydroxylase-related dioxygenase (phytanoyl-CoA dioxygenase family)